MGRTRDLWTDEGATKSVNRPQPVRISKGWDVRPDVLPSKEAAPRRRKYAPIRPNNREAVATPHGGQSYNPVDEEHQAALRVAVKKLEKKKKADDKFVRMITFGRDAKISGNFSADKLWEEEVKEKPAAAAKKRKTPEVLKKEMADKKRKEKKKKKLGKKGSEREAVRALTHRRHPNRAVAVKEVEALDKLLETHTTKMEKRETARLKRREAKKENLAIKHYGRHYHTPLALDVAVSDRLVGSLRHMSGGYIHPALDRMKSLEERNLVPARMRHTYNKRKILKPKGQVRVKRETFGVLPETSF